MKNRYPVLGAKDIIVSLETGHVLEGQGIDPHRAGPNLVAAAGEVLEEAQSLIDPAAVYTFLKVRDFHHQTVMLDEWVTFQGPLAARALAGSKEVALAVCTIGVALELRVKELFSGDPVRALALDGAGIAALRTVSEHVVERVRETASKKGWGSGMRAQPGQEGWPIEQQSMMFKALPTREIGVRLSGSGLMIPQKSVSMVVGMGPDMRPDRVACEFCSKRGRCAWRIK
ncbi:MAG: hypothetical protein PVG49_11765 [Desulfobacteraceae bacterium]